LQALLVEPEQSSDEDTILETLLMTFEVLVSYRRHNPGELNMPQALRFLLQDPLNPRSLLYQLTQLQNNLANLPANKPSNTMQDEALRTLESISLVSLADTTTLAAIEQSSGRRTELEQLLIRSKMLTNDISSLLSARYFVASPNPSQLFTQNWSLD
ncbi:MAG: hypothetical protein HKO71_00230, partial [Pseudomonadales bacterium]|nr:hypothetical protein [Pseudomonadales bacterium]